SLTGGDAVIRVDASSGRYRVKCRAGCAKVHCARRDAATPRSVVSRARQLGFDTDGKVLVDGHAGDRLGMQHESVVLVGPPGSAAWPRSAHDHVFSPQQVVGKRTVLVSRVRVEFV